MVTVFWLLNAAMTANPIGLIVVGLAALAAGLVVAYRESDEFRAVIDAAFKVVSAAFGFVLNAAQDVFGWLKGNWPLVLGILTGPIGLAVVMILKHWDTIKATTASVWNAIKSFLSSVWSAILSAAGTAWNAIRTAITAPVSAAAGVLSGIWSGITSTASAAWSATRSAASTAWGAVKTAITTPINAAADIVRSIVGKLREWLGEAWEAIAKGVERIRKPFVGAFGEIRDTIKDVVGWLGKAKDAVQSVIEWLGKIKVPKISLPDLNPFGGAGNGTTVGPMPSLPANVDGFNMLASKFGNVVTSGYRPGDDGWHGRNRARDYAGGNMMGFARAMLAYAPKLLELIYTPLGMGVKNGQVVPMSFFGSAVMADHFDHVHVAMQTGGVVKRGGWALVGERGPELARLPGGTTVYDHSQTQTVMRTGYEAMPALSPHVAGGSSGADIAGAVADALEGMNVTFVAGGQTIREEVRVHVDRKDRAMHQELMAGVA